MDKKNALLGGLAVSLVLLGLGGGLVWALWPDTAADAEPGDTAAGDTGMSLEQQERLMKEIGYTQQ